MQFYLGLFLRSKVFKNPLILFFFTFLILWEFYLSNEYTLNLKNYNLQLFFEGGGLFKKIFGLKFNAIKFPIVIKIFKS